jgi:hypothetical protein
MIASLFLGGVELITLKGGESSVHGQLAACHSLCFRRLLLFPLSTKQLTHTFGARAYIRT